MIVIDLGEIKNIDSFKLKSDAKVSRLQQNVRFVSFMGLSKETINIREIDFFNSKDIVTAPEPSPTPDPKPTTEPTPTPNPTPIPEPNPSEPTEPTEPTEPSQPTGDHAILTVTMDNGFDKEFDLSKKELTAFIAWYDAKDAGRGPSFFAIDKHNNNKGPFSNRKNYVIFNKVLTFEISKYSTK